MYSVTVIPINKAIFKEYLTYFSAKMIPNGTLVTVPVRSKDIMGLVIQCQSLKEDKASIKRSDFALKKISKIHGTPLFRSAFFDAARSASQYYACDMGRLLATVIPTLLLNNYEELTPAQQDTEKNISIENEKLVFQSSPEDRLSAYKTYIRASFAKKQSVFVVVPTIKDIEYYKEELGRGITPYVFGFASTIKDKVLLETYNKVLTEPHPVVIITTGQYLVIPRTDIGTIIVEKEASPHYKTLARPFVDYRIFAELYARALGIKILFSDTLTRVETLERIRLHELSEFISPSFRIPKEPHFEIIEKSTKKMGVFEVLSNESIEKLEHAVQSNESVLILAMRKGFASSIVCHDCSEVVVCPTCKHGISVHDDDGVRTLYCDSCKKKQSANIICSHCGSWNLVSLGIGTDRIRMYLKEFLPKAKVYQLDKAKVPTEKQIEKTIADFEDGGGILIGTESAIHALTKQVSHVLVLSFDGLRSIPHFRIEEKIIRMMRELKEKASKSIILETRDPNAPLVTTIVQNQVAEWYRVESEARKRFGYPPTKTLIKISWMEAKSTPDIHTLFEGYEYYPMKKGKLRSLLLKIDRDTWALPLLSTRGVFDIKLAEILTSLSPSYSIEVDTEHTI